jgi:hypothetical protein
MKILNKKAALSLSVEAIVILVIAFVVLGLALTLTRYIFGAAQEKAGSALDIIELESKPTPDNPITIQRTVTISRGDSIPMDIGVYNTKGIPYSNATLGIASCTSTGATPAPVTNPPTIVTIAQTIKQSEIAGYRAFLTENGLDTGNYICILNVYNLGTNDVYDSEQFYLTVTA